MTTTATSMKESLKTLIDAMGEDINYKKDSGVVREVRMLVDRALSTEIGAAATPSITIHFLNDADDGITSAELDTGLDAYEIAERFGGTAVYRGIANIIEQDQVGIILGIK